MRTITSYSYKGGVGRSLLVANTMKYLSSLGKKVFAIDMDLEAPGLHYKFELDSGANASAPSRGLVELMSYFLTENSMPNSLSPFVNVIPASGSAEEILMMRAGAAPGNEYWQTLSRINWHKILYNNNSPGILFFLELKERIRLDYNPDYLLIDARTGITEMAAIATTLLPDTVLCMALPSREHLEGLRAVMQTISRTAKADNLNLDIVPVISRVRSLSGNLSDLEEIREILNSDIATGDINSSSDGIVVLHAEPLLDAGEQLLVGGRVGPHETVLLQDYLRLFARVIPAEDVQPFVGRLIKQAVERILDDPDAAQSELESLTAYCADLDAYRALLKLYLVRKASSDKILSTASLMWKLSSRRAPPEDLIHNIIRLTFSEPRPAEAQKRFAFFAEEVWRASNMDNIRIGLTIAGALLPENRARATQLLLDYLQSATEIDYTAVTRLVEIAVSDKSSTLAYEIIEKYKTIIANPEFYAAWARLTLSGKRSNEAVRLLNDPYFGTSVIRATDPIILYRVMKLAQDSSAPEVLASIFEDAMRSESMMQLRMLGEIYYEEGNLDEFEYRLSNKFPEGTVEEIIEASKRKGRRIRPARFASAVEW